MNAQIKRKILTGTVVSNKMDKTIVVKVERTVQHPVYGKYIRKTSKFYAHDPENSCQPGDQVKIMENRPLSHLKRWRLMEKINK